MMVRFLITIFFSCALLSLLGNEGKRISDDVQSAWKPAAYEVIGDYKTVSITQFANVFSSGKNNIVKLAPELTGLTGVRFPVAKGGLFEAISFTLRFVSNTRLLVGLFRDSARREDTRTLASIKFEKGKPDLQPILVSAITITGMPSIDVYAIQFAKGSHTVQADAGKPWIFVGAISARQKLIARNVELPDGRLWHPFIIEGFYDQKPLFEIIGGPDSPVIDEGMPGTEGIQGGFEGGSIVRVGNTYHMFPTERAGQVGIEPYYDRVKTRIGHWTSSDAKTWQRVSTIYQASGVYAITDDDNPLNDRRGAIWSYMPIFNKAKNRWFGYYLTYTVHKTIEPNHSFGRIWQTESKTGGIQGISGPYGEGKLVIEPGLNSQLWEGRQGVASFFPYPVEDHWLGFYAGAYPYLKREDYPATSGKGWFVGLAKADSLEGPWTRLDSTVNPVRTIHPWFVENPIVYRMPNGIYLSIFDGGPEGWGHYLPNMIGYTTSKDGYHWSEAHYLPIETKVKKWWKIMRTPLCLIPEGNNVYTIVYAAINEKRFHPMGMVQVRMNMEVLNARLKW
jgi:hypothetical protein